jgi:predicted metal-dependent HD superfamily phosphohydrolase
VIEPERLAALKTGWGQLLARYAVSQADSAPVLDRLVAAYSEPHRHYHTLEHLGEMFAIAEELANVARDPAAVDLAIWFHDAAYDPRAADNEERSAALLTDLLRPLGVPAAILAHVGVMIRSTAHTTAGRFDADTAVLLDADLAVLGADEPRYVRYAADIRREYAWVEDSAYRIGRTKVLQGFMARPRIYRTERMHAIADEPARRNLQAEIDRLRLP